MNQFGQIIRNLRLENELPLRKIAAYLDIDQAILSKIEKGQRKASKTQVLELSRFFKLKSDELLINWLSDKILVAVENEDLALDAIKQARKIILKNK